MPRSAAPEVLEEVLSSLVEPAPPSPAHAAASHVTRHKHRTAVGSLGEPGAEPQPDPTIAAISAFYYSDSRHLSISLSTGAILTVPVTMIEGLAERRHHEIGVVKIMPGGVGLAWPNLDVHLNIDGLLQGSFGSAKWMRKVRAKLGWAFEPEPAPSPDTAPPPPVGSDVRERGTGDE